MDWRRVLVVSGLVSLVIAVLLVGGVLALYGTSYQAPQVESINSSFGAVSEEQTVIETRVVVVNPNDRALPGNAQVDYTVSLNDVQVAEGQKNGLNIGPGRNVLNLSIELDNDKIPPWWVTHVANDEQTTLTVETSASSSLLPLSRGLPAETQTLRTDMLASLSNSSESETIAVANETVLSVSNRSVEWGAAGARTTPVVVSSRLTNTHDYPVTLNGTEYEIQMNDVVVGGGTTDEQLELSPGETTTYTVTADIDTPKMADWWRSHIRNDQRTELNVTAFAVTDDDGERVTLPVAVFQRRAGVQTDMLDGGTTTVQSLAVDDGRSRVDRPTVGEPVSRWGAVRAETTEIVTSTSVDNPNGERFSRLIDVETRYAAAIEGIEVASGVQETEGIPTGESMLELRTNLSHDDVPRWWARHVNNGETSRVNTTVESTADVGVTRFDLPVTVEDKRLVTDLLEGYQSSTEQPIEVDGQTALVVEETTAEWGQATPSEGPVTVTVTLRNELSQEVTVSDINYSTTLNEVVLADQTLDTSVTLDPSERRTVTFEVVLNNSRTADWWPTHVRNNERSTLRSQSFATIEVRGRTSRAEITSLSQNRTITTDLFADRDENRGS